MIAGLAVLAGAACSPGSSSRRQPDGQSGTAFGGAGGAAGSSGAGGAAGVVDAECARFELTFSQLTSCGTCSNDISTLCPCTAAGFVAAIVADRYLTCAFGRCLSGMDCPATCTYLGDPNAVASDFNDALEVLLACLDAALTVSCDSDAVCNGGRCVGEADSGGGICRSGGYSAKCRNAGDCQSGICVNFDANEQRCTVASPGDTCNDDSHCGRGKCLEANADAGVGICTNGASNEPCVTKADCIGYACVPNSSLRFGDCSDGNLYDRCAEPTNCRSNLCVQGSCESGEEAARCTGPRECKSGFCELGSGSGDLPVGYCVSGDDGTSCYNDASCKSGLCGLNVGHSLPGRCTAGTEGESCATNDDCTSKSCAASQPPVVMSSCEGDSAGLPCGNGGVCASDGACHYGRCS